CVDSQDAVAKILLVHGHMHGVKMGLDRLAYAAKEAGANAAFYGHTHLPVVTNHGGIFIMNPGSPSFPRGGSKASYGIAEISPKGAISGRIIAA
ncbi:MAG: metallophosphoesterase family protein, partial [Defluviitaleaceae bacterium]|nr:metallophosphoesterase family protein [Defluviitaleaceae bacterium]